MARLLYHVAHASYASGNRAVALKQAVKGALRKAGLRRANIARIRKVSIRREQVAAVRMCCERHLLATLGRSRKRWIGRILCYHSVGTKEWGVNDVTPSQFRRHIELALDAGYRFVPASVIAATGGGPQDLAITFDDGLKTQLTQAAPILKEYGVPFTIFPVSEWCQNPHWFGEDVMLDWRDLERLMYMGAEIGSHSATHPDFGSIELARTVDELGNSRETIRRMLGIPADSFAIPLGQSGNWTPATMKAARDAGYTTVYAQAEETRPAGTIARTFITRFDGDRIFRAALKGKFDQWEEWI